MPWFFAAVHGRSREALSLCQREGGREPGGRHVGATEGPEWIKAREIA